MLRLMRILGAMAVMILTLAATRTYAKGEDDIDQSKLRIQGVWWYSQPSGSFKGKNSSGEFDLKKDFGFGDYSTFSGLVDWRFKRKHHLLFGVAPIISDKTMTITRTIQFQGQTFNVGASVNVHLKSLSFSPGYQYDIFRRKHGYLALATQVHFMDTSATLKTTASVNGQSATTTASGSILAPLPVVGPRFLWYPTNSSRFSLEGSLQGMYFFGYGNILSANGAAAIEVNRHLDLRFGYQMGSRLSIHGTTDNIGVKLTQKGPTAGLVLKW